MSAAILSMKAQAEWGSWLEQYGAVAQLANLVESDIPG